MINELFVAVKDNIICMIKIFIFYIDTFDIVKK